MKRRLTRQEAALISGVADKLDPEQRAQLRADMGSVQAEAANDFGSLIEFEIEGYVRPPGGLLSPFPVEMKMLDCDGAQVSVILHGDENGRLYQLEFVRWGEGDFIEPQWQTLEIE